MMSNPSPAHDVTNSNDGSKINSSNTKAALQGVYLRGDGCEILHQLIDGKHPILGWRSTILSVVDRISMAHLQLYHSCTTWTVASVERHVGWSGDPRTNSHVSPIWIPYSLGSSWPHGRRRVTFLLLLESRWIQLNPRNFCTQKAPNPLGSGSAAVDLGGFRRAFGVRLLRFRWRAPEHEDRPLPVAGCRLPLPCCPRMTSLQIFANSYGLFHGGGWTWLGHIGSYHLHVIEIKWKCLTRNLLANQIQEDHHPKSGWNVSCLKCYCIV